MSTSIADGKTEAKADARSTGLLSASTSPPSGDLDVLYDHTSTTRRPMSRAVLTPTMC